MLDLIPVLSNGTSVLLVVQVRTQLIMFVPPSLFIILFILFILYFHHHIFIKKDKRVLEFRGSLHYYIPRD